MGPVQAATHVQGELQGTELPFVLVEIIQNGVYFVAVHDLPKVFSESLVANDSEVVVVDPGIVEVVHQLAPILFE